MMNGPETKIAPSKRKKMNYSAHIDEAENGFVVRLNYDYADRYESKTYIAPDKAAAEKIISDVLKKMKK